ncbi:SCO2322 family protein [Luteipulveratus mongoliensis]|uniref:Uncharacterized protein n=1 Tax=Luteipulveratus mongoliensis TaxID=571913 RepID=A0A0K1JR51_9MICO|nr:SCO2322 family protein [Luteipulveratus mongoliensis]AKU19035.1 hypothetical protein VV02_17110 [Luteipulveratus mongoliensis]
MSHRQSRSYARPWILVALGVLLALTFGTATAPRASAAAFRFWGYYQLKGTSWTFAPKGPAQVTPADGAVEGWRWAVGSETDTRMPRGVVTFAQVCADTPAKSGTKRVGVVIDFGRAADAESGTPPTPRSACAQVPTKATGADVLAAVAAVRTEKGMVCAVGSWPATGCGGPVKTVSAAAKAVDDKVTIAVAKPAEDKASSSNTMTIVLVAGVVVLLLLGALLTLLRRRRTETA